MIISELYVIKSTEYLVKVFQENREDLVFVVIENGPETKILTAMGSHFEVIFNQLVLDKKWVEIQINDRNKFVVEKISKEFYLNFN